jgi:hypothetical protein
MRQRRGEARPNVGDPFAVGPMSSRAKACHGSREVPLAPTVAARSAPILTIKYDLTGVEGHA